MRTRSLALASALLAAPLGAQEAVRLPPSDSTAVVVDVVVRDGKGRPVTDLVAADFEVLEDATAQVVAQFVPPKAAEAAEAAPENTPPAGPLPPAPSASSALTERDTIAFVFDRLSASGRVAAQKAARTHLEKRGLGNTGVFSIESSLVVLQEFTTDQTLALAAIGALGDRVAHAGGSQMEKGRASLAGRVAANKAQQTLAQVPAPGPGRAQASIAAIRASMAQAAADAFDRLERDEHGFATAHALTAIVDALRTVPGRKAIVLFSGGLYRTEGTENRFLSVIHAANRASVAVYAVEADGLQTSSSESLTGAEIHSVANTSMARQESGLDTGGGAFTRDLERAEDITKFNPRASLQWISEGTGGTFTRDTNDLEGALGRIGSDLRSYYLLGYTPRNERWDGRFRKIAVRTKRKGLEVSARSGYFAVRSAGPVLAHVAPALAVLESGHDRKDVLLFAGAAAFPSGEGEARSSVGVTVPGADVARLAGKARGRLDVTLLARVVGADGKAVDAMSRRFVVDKGAPAADLLLLRDAWLSPGTYTVEAVAYDASGGQAGVVRTAFEVKNGARPLEGAQVVIVKGVVPVAEAPVELEVGHPLRFGDVVLQPLLSGEPLAQKSPRPFIVQVTVPGGPPPPSATINVFRGETQVATAGVRFGQAEPGGLLRHVAEVPVGAWEAGAYELRATLSDGRHERLIRIPFTVSP